MRLIVTLLCVGFASMAQAQTADICKFVLDEFAKAKVSGITGARSVVERETRFFDILSGRANVQDENAPYRGFYVQDGAIQRDFDIKTIAHQNHNNCIQVDGFFYDDNNDDVIVKRDRDAGNPNAPFPVSIFAFDSGAFAGTADSAGGVTNVRTFVAALPLVANRREDPFGTLRVSVYISGLQKTTTVGSLGPGGAGTSGEALWMAADIGNGPQLVAIACSSACSSFFPPGESGVPRLYDTLGTGAQPQPEPVAPEANFAREKLVFVNQGVEGERPIDLSKLEDTDAKEAVRETLDALKDGGEDIAALYGDGLLDLEPQDWELVDFSIEHRVVLRRVGPTRLTAVQLNLSEPKSLNFLAGCVFKAEVSHADFDEPIVVDVTVDLNANTQTVAGYRTFGVELPQNHEMLSQSINTLSVRIFPTAPANTEVSEPSCLLSWGNSFPDQAFMLPEISAATDIPNFSFLRDGTAVFDAVSVVSTERPVHIYMYSVTGPVDSNGLQTDAELFPKWNTPQSTNDLMEALFILRAAAHSHFTSEGEKKVYLRAAQGGEARGFEAVRALTPTEIANPSIQIGPGQVGIESLKVSLEQADPATAQPIAVVIGRSGLRRASDYCTSRPAVGDDLAANMILIDFMPGAVFSQFTNEEQDAFRPDFDDDAVNAAFNNFPIFKCPSVDAHETISHWILLPDFRSRFTWRNDLETLASHIFGAAQ
ncbi:MAG: hypothetical protein AAF393_07505 [Pseudomonadota bacterium]